MLHMGVWLNSISFEKTGLTGEMMVMNSVLWILISEGQHFRVRYVKPWTFSLLVCCHRILRVFSLDGSQFNAISKYYYLVYGHLGNPTLNHSLGGVVGIHSSHSPQKTGTKPRPSSRSIWRIILVIHHLLLKVYSSDISSNRSNDRCCVGCSSKQPPKPVSFDGEWSGMARDKCISQPNHSRIHPINLNLHQWAPINATPLFWFCETKPPNI